MRTKSADAAKVKVGAREGIRFITRSPGRLAVVACLLALVQCTSSHPDERATGDASAEGGAAAHGAGSDAPVADAGADRAGVLQGYIYAHTSESMYRIDASTLRSPMVKVVAVGSFSFTPNEMTDLAITPTDRIYGVSWVGGGGAGANKLWEVDPDTGVARYVSDVPGTNNVALTFDVDGTLLGADKQGNFRRIDPATGAVTPLGTWGTGYSAAGDIVGVKDGTLYAVTDSGGGSSGTNNGLVKLDRMTGAATPVGLIGHANIFGAAFWCGRVYAFNDRGDILEVDTATGAGTRVGGTSTSWWGAAVTPRAPLGGTGETLCPP